MRVRRVLSALLAALALLSACSNGAPPATPAAGPGTPAPGATPPPDAAGATPAPAQATITFGVYEFQRARYEPIIEAFHAEQPDVRVQIVSLDEVLFVEGEEPPRFDVWMRRLASAADTLATFDSGPEMVSMGFMRDLGPFIAADPTFDQSDFLPGALRPAPDGTVAMIPDALSVELLAYNKDLWAARGVPAPSPDWSWDDLLQAAAQIAEKRGDEVQIYGLLDRDGGLSALRRELQAAGVELGAPGAPGLDDPQVVAALERVQALFDSGALFFPPRYPDGSFLHSTDYIPLIEGGRLGMWTAGMEAARAQGPLPFAMGIAPYPPALDRGPASLVSGLMMSAGTLYPEAAWRWLSFLSRNAPPPDAFADVGVIPARASIAERDGFWEGLDAEARAAIEATLARTGTASAQPVRPDGAAALALSELGEALNAVLSGEQSAAVALRDAQARFEERIAARATEPTPTADPRPIAVATPLPERQAAPDAVTITFGMPGFVIDDPRAVADAFNEQNPDLFVTIKTIEFTGGPISLTDLAAQADCFASAGMPSPSDAGAALDLQPLIDADPTFPRDDYAAATLAPFRLNGELIGLPLSLGFRVLVFNQDMFDAAGLAYPTAEWSIDDLLLAAQQLTAGSGESRSYGFVGADPGSLFFFLQRSGAAPVRPAGVQIEPAFTDPWLVEALLAYIDLLKNASPHTGLFGYSRNVTNDPSQDAIAAGRVGMWLSFNSAGFLRIGEPSFTAALAPIPLDGGALGPDDFFARGLYISAQTQYPEACWRWIRHLSEQTQLIQDGFPPRSSQLEALGDDGTPGRAEMARAYSEALKRGAPGSGDISWFTSGVDFFWFFRAVDRAIQGGDLEAELSQAQQLTELFLACVRAGGEAASCAREADPDHQGWNTGP